jgi:hypothetical protein
MQNLLIIIDLVLFGCFILLANYIALLIIKSEATGKPVKRSLIVLAIGLFNMLILAIFLEFFKL